VFKALQRGMSPRPEDRFAAMDELLARIERDPRAKMRRTAALVATLAVTGATSVALFGDGEALEVCPDARAELAGVWDAARAEAVRAAVRAADPAHGAETLARVEPRIERFAGAWTGMRNDACRAHAEGRQSIAVFDLRTACLDQRRASLDSVVDALAAAEAGNLELLTRAVAGLPSLDGCADVDWLSAAIPPPAELERRARVQQHREALARAAVLEQTAQIPRGLELVEAVLAAPETAAYEPLRAEALLGKGGLQMRDGAWSAALQSFEEALWTALGIDHAPVAAQASSRRGFLLATPLTRPEQALADLPMITALNRRVQQDVELRAEFLVNAGTIHLQVRDFERARSSWQEATALLEAHGRLETPLGINALANTAILELETERLEEAVASLRRVVEVSEEIMGPRQPERANYEGVLSGALIDLGRPREALARMRALAGRVDDVQSKGARFVATLMLARAEMMAGAPREALERMAALRRTEPALFGPFYAPMVMLAAALAGDAAAVREAQVDARAYLDRAAPREPGYKQAIEYYAAATRAAGLEAASVEPLVRAHAAFAGSQDPIDVVTAARLSLDLGRARLRVGELEAAERELRAALAAFERALPPHHLDRAEALSALAELALTQGRADEAARRATAAAAIYGATAEPDYPPLIHARELLARATVPRGGE
jgi:tetratricopeptide (TPR) repeat protein